MRRLLIALVRLFPADFRERFGDEIESQVRRDYDQARARSLPRAVRFSMATAWDLVHSAVAEHRTGNREKTGRETRELRMKTTLEDLARAARSLRRVPGFTAMAVGTLAVAMGALAAIHAVVDRVVVEPLPFEQPDRLISISASAPGSTEFSGELGPSMEFVLQYREAELLEDVTTYDSFTATFRAGERAERLRMAITTSELFPMLGVDPVLGRWPTSEDEGSSLVLSHALWVDWFGADPDILGRSFPVFGPPLTVVGVMGPDFDLPDFAIPGQRVMLWIPEEIDADGVTPGDFGHDVVARMIEGADIGSVTVELNRLASRLPDRFGGSPAYARFIERHQAIVRPLKAELLGSASRSIWVLFGALAVVLLVACANVTNLFLARVERRRRDFSVRRAMGAGRFRIGRIQLAEVGIVSLAGAVLAFAIAWMGLPALVATAPAVHRLAGVGVSGSTAGFLGVAAVFSTVVCGLIPTVRSGAAGLGALRDGSRGSTAGRSWARDGLVVGQTALALILLAGSALLLRSFQELKNVDPGYDVEDVFTFQMAPEADHLVDGPSWAAFHQGFMDRIRALPGVESVGLVENVPLNEGVGGGRFFTEETAASGSEGALVGYTAAGGDYFRTMGIEVLRGRAFEEADHVSNLGNVVVSRSAAELLWPGEDPVGERIQWRGLETWETVVGVVDDVMQGSFRDEPQPLVYLPMTGQEPELWGLSSPAYVVKTERAGEIGSEIRGLVRELAPGAPVYRTFTMEQLAADSMRQLSFSMLVVVIAAVLALILGAVGLYGVLSYVVVQRTREIGVRMALGAEARGVRRMVVREGSRVVILGVVIGLVGGVVTTRMLGGLLFGVEAADPVTFAAVSALMILVGILASYLPARRASSVDPVQSLKAG